MGKSAAYILSAYSFIATTPPDKLLDVGFSSKNGNPIPSFDEDLLIDLCNDAMKIFEKESNVLEIEGDLIIVGDIHGSFHDLLRIIKFIQQNNSKVLFLGDYVDRGCFSLECISLLFALKVTHPDMFYLIRGNHEFDSVCSAYGFKEEILNYHDPKKLAAQSNKRRTSSLRLTKAQSLICFETEQKDQEGEYYSHSYMDCYKYSEKLYEAFINTFAYLPIAAVANKTTFCIHGGLSPNLDSIESINRSVQRPIFKLEDNPLLSDVVWSDPSHGSSLFDENPRGRGYLFNRESVLIFLKGCQLNRMIRAHQCVNLGILQNFSDKCITVFSASSYDQFMGNSSSILQLFQQDDTIKPTTFAPLYRLQKIDAVYCKVQPLGEKNNHVCFSLLHPKLSNNVSFRSSNKVTRKITSIKSENSLSLSTNIRTSPLVKPKFITNKRKSINFVRKPLIYDLGGNEYDENAVEYLPASVC